MGQRSREIAISAASCVWSRIRRSGSTDCVEVSANPVLCERSCRGRGYPNALNVGVTHDSAKLAAYKAQEASRKQGQLEIWRKQRKAEIVVIPNATHYIFLSEEAEVLSLIIRFVGGLPQSETPH